MSTLDEQLGALIWIEFADALSLLEDQLVGRDGNGLGRLLSRIGWRLDALDHADPQPMLQALGTLRTTLLEAAHDPADPTGSANAAAATAAAARVRDELDALVDTFQPALDAATAAVADATVRQSFAVDLVEHLVIEWLVDRVRPLVLVAEGLGLLRWEAPDAITGPDGSLLRRPVERRTMPLFRLVSIALDPIAVLAGDGPSPDATFAAVEHEARTLLDGLQRRLASLAAGDFDVRLTPTSVEIVGFDPPWFHDAGASDGDPPLNVPLPLALTDPTGSGSGPVLSLLARPDAVGLGWDVESIVGAAPAAPGETVLLEIDGFRLIVGAAAPVGAATTPVAATPTPASLTLSPPIDDTTGPTLVASGGLRLEMPASWLSDGDGASLAIGASGTVTATTFPTADGSLPDVELLVDLGVVQATATGVRIGGASGLLVESAAIALTDVRFPAVATPGLVVSGQVRIGGSAVSATATLDDAGFHVTSTAEVDLPGGVRFEPVDGLPVLDVHVPFGGGAVTAALAGAVRLPRGPGLESVEFVGTLALDAGPSGLTVHSVTAAAQVSGSWELPGGIVVRAAAAALAHDAVGQMFAVELSGEVEFGDGTLTLDHARFGFTPDAVELDVSLSANDVAIDDVARLRSGTVALHVLAATDGSAASGSLALADGAADFVPSDGGWLVTVDDVAASIVVDSRFRLELTSGKVSFPVPFDQGTPNARASAQVDSFVFEVDANAVTLDGGFSLASDLVLWSSGGFRLAVTSGTGFEIALGPNQAPRIGVTGGARFDISPDALRNVDSVEQVSAAIAGSTTLVLDDPPTIEFSDVDITLGPGTFQLGDTEAMRLSNATIALRSIERLTDPTPADPFEIALTGRLQLADSGPALSLTDATFVFEGQPLPRFQPGGVGVESGDFGDDLPFRVTAASFELVDPTLPFPESIEPSNLRIGMSVGLELPLGADGAGVMARADQVEVDLSGPFPTVTLDGIGMGVDGLSLGVLEVSGLLYVGGLGSLADLPGAISGNTPPGQRPLFMAGKLGGRYNGTKLAVLLATRPDEPLGACLDVAIDGGITLLYGFTLNGVSGGVSFANTPGNPCDIRSYIDFDALPPAASETGWTEEPGDHGFDGGVAVTPETGCDCNCPPPSMNPLCQPHPDGAAYPGRAILKFSAISEQMLDDWGLLAVIDGAAGDAQAAIGALITGLRDALAPMVPALPDDFALPAGTPPELVEIARRPIDAVVDPLHERLLEIAEDGVTDLRTRLLDALWAGIECPDVTLQVTGTFSYTGVGYFLTVTGGVNVGTTGAGGIIGSVNLFGIPIGTLRAFISGTDDEGMPRTGLCGDLDVSFGPFDLGRLCVTTSIPALETVLFEAAVEHVPRLMTIGGSHGVAVLEALLDTVDLDPVTSPGTLAERVAWIDLDDAAGIVTTLSSGGLAALGDAAAGAASDPEVIAWLGDLFVTLWDGYDPSLSACGLVQPRIFGLPLMSELATLSVSADKQRFTASTTFSLSQLIAAAFGGVGGFLSMPTDYVTLSIGCGFPDPVDVGIQTFLEIGQNRADPAQALLDNLAAEVDRMLEQTLYGVGVAIRPFGLELADTQSRVVLPDLLDYPVASWSPPDDRAAVLDAALAADLIVDPEWTGELAAAAGLASSHAGLDLRHDYFPHGGWMGAGHLSLPRLLADAPPIELIGRIIDNDDILDRLGAIATFAGEWIAQTTQIGTMSFYVPAPAPPANLDGTLIERLGQMTEHAALGGIRSDLFFGAGELSPSLFGVVLGTASAHVELPGPEGPGRLEITSQLGGGWLADVVGMIDVTARVTTPPPLPTGMYFGLVEQLVALASAGKLTRTRIDAAIAAAAAAHVEDPAHREAVRALLADTFSDISTVGTSVERQTRLAEAVAGAVADMLPKVSLDGQSTGLDLPEPFAGLITVQSARLAAYSPWFDPVANDDDLFGQVKRYGGVAVEVTGAAVSAFGWHASLDTFVASLRGGPGGIPIVDAVARVSGVNLPGLALGLAEFRLSNDGAATATLELSGDELAVGGARLVPIPGATASADAVRLTVDLTSGSAVLEPCRLMADAGLGVAAATVTLHGSGGESDAFTFDRAGPWSAAATVDRLELDVPGGPRWVAGDVADVVVEGDGTALTMLGGRVDLPIDAVGPIELSNIELFPSVDVDAAVRLHATLRGFDGAITADASGSLTWRGQQLSFDTGERTFTPGTVAALQSMVLAGVVAAFEQLFVSFDAFVAAVNGGWVEWRFDPVRLGRILTRAYGFSGVAEVTSALGRLALSPRQVEDVLRSLFTWAPHVDVPLIPHGDTWVGTIDTHSHGDAVLVPHGDGAIGPHTDGVLHGDVAAGHADIPGVHVDEAAVAHLDQAPTLHADVAAELHADLSGVGHVDTARGPHADAGIGPLHGDGHVPPHGDVAGAHVDVAAVPHADAAATVHGDVDASAHADTGTPHVDGLAPPPHGDTQTHADVDPVHIDSVEAHIDELVHADEPGIHIDTPEVGHGDVGAGFRDDGQSGGHADAPPTPHADQPAVPHGDSRIAVPWHVDSPARRHSDVPGVGSEARLPNDGRRGRIIPSTTVRPPTRERRPGPTPAPRPPARRRADTPPVARRSPSPRVVDNLSDRVRDSRRHADRAAEPHGDAPPAGPHVDVPATPHGDRAAEPHADGP